MKKVFERLNKLMKSINIGQFLIKYIEDMLIVSGLAVLVGTTFLLSKILGLYSLGVVLLGLGIYLAKYPPGRR